MLWTAHICAGISMYEPAIWKPWKWHFEWCLTCNCTTMKLRDQERIKISKILGCSKSKLLSNSINVRASRENHETMVHPEWTSDELDYIKLNESPSPRCSHYHCNWTTKILCLLQITLLLIFSSFFSSA